MGIDKKITWIPAEEKFSLAARLETDPFRWLVGIGEHDMDPIQTWCEENNCGKRTSFDTFCFRNQQEMSLFLLKWS